MLKYTDIFEMLEDKERQPVAAIYMSYGFDAQLFEEHVLPAFLGVQSGADSYDLQTGTKFSMYFRNQVALKLREIPIAVFSDGNQYPGGRSFLYDHIVVHNMTFHPKCYLLLFKEYLRVIVTSANLTVSGLCYNAEVIWHEDIYPDKESSIAGDLHDVLLNIAEIGSNPLPEAVKVILQYLLRVRGTDTSVYPMLVSTCQEESPFLQITRAIDGYSKPPKEVTILSPFFENDRESECEQSMAISFLSRFAATIQVNFYFPATLQNGKWFVRAPMYLFSEISQKFSNVKYFVVTSQWEQEDADKVQRPLHAKIIDVRFSDKTFLCMGGSVNFTQRAMNSNSKHLRNVEIGIMEMTKKPFPLPDCTPVRLEELKVLEETQSTPKPVCFITSAILEYRILTIEIDKTKVKYPYSIIYSSKLLKTVTESNSQLTFANFNLGHDQDLEIVATDGTFYFPIMVMNKAEIMTDDLKWDFTIELSDMIDYLAGKYRSMSELGRTISGKKPVMHSSLNALYFRQNLQRYFKAMDALKQGLEQQFFSEYAFHNYLTSPVGLQKLTDLILDEFEKKSASRQESFLFLSEMLNILLHLSFASDWVDMKYKHKEIDSIITRLYPIIKTILSDSKGIIRQQYRIICDTYGIEVK